MVCCSRPWVVEKRNILFEFGIECVKITFKAPKFCITYSGSGIVLWFCYHCNSDPAIDQRADIALWVQVFWHGSTSKFFTWIRSFDYDCIVSTLMKFETNWTSIKAQKPKLQQDNCRFKNFLDCVLKTSRLSVYRNAFVHSGTFVLILKGFWTEEKNSELWSYHFLSYDRQNHLQYQREQNYSFYWWLLVLFSDKPVFY